MSGIIFVAIKHIIRGKHALFDEYLMGRSFIDIFALLGWKVDLSLLVGALGNVHWPGSG